MLKVAWRFFAIFKIDGFSEQGTGDFLELFTGELGVDFQFCHFYGCFHLEAPYNTKFLIFQYVYCNSPIFKKIFLAVQCAISGGGVLNRI